MYEPHSGAAEMDAAKQTSTPTEGFPEAVNERITEATSEIIQKTNEAASFADLEETEENTADDYADSTDASPYLRTYGWEAPMYVQDKVARFKLNTAIRAAPWLNSERKIPVEERRKALEEAAIGWNEAYDTLMNSSNLIMKSMGMNLKKELLLIDGAIYNIISILIFKSFLVRDFHQNSGNSAKNLAWINCGKLMNDTSWSNNA